MSSPTGGHIHSTDPFATPETEKSAVRRLRGRLASTVTLWTAPGPARIATVSTGYADGFLRSLGNRAKAYHGDTALPVVGVVSMDTITLDATGLPGQGLEPGALVDLIGEHNPVDAVAEAAGTIGYEILTSLGGRYFRTYLGG